VVKEAVEGRGEAEDVAYGSVGLRIAIWRNTLEMVKDRPILGFGLGNHKVFYPIYHRKVVQEKVFSEEAQLHNVHNDYLQILSETGIVGFGFLVLLFLLWVRSVFRLAIKSKDSPVDLWAMGMFIAILGIMTNAFFCFPSFRAVPPTIVMTFTALFFVLELNSSLTKEISIVVPRVPSFIIGGLVVAFGIFLCFYYGKLIISDKYYMLISRNETKKNWQGIIDLAPKELVLEPDRAKIRSYLGRAYIELGRCKEGAEELEKVVKAYPYHMNALLNLGVAYACTGEYEKALESYGRVLEIKPDYAKVYNNIGHIHMRQGHTDKAIEALKEALKYNEKEPTILLNLGILYLNTHQIDQAISYLERSIEQNPKIPASYRHLGLAYLQRGDLSRARQALEKALSLDPNQPGKEELKKILEDIKAQKGGS
jgi:tetratricopeptide (TPR) repeat protein